MWRSPVGDGAMRTRTLIGLGCYPAHAGLGAGRAAVRRIAHTDGRSRITAHEAQYDERQPQRLDEADRIRERAYERHPERHQDERAERVVRADPRLRMLGHLLLEDREPERQVHGDPDAADERRRRDHRPAAQGEGERLQETSVAARTQTTSGRRGRIRIATTPPTTAPTPPAVRITAHGPARRARRRSQARARPTQRRRGLRTRTEHRGPEPRAELNSCQPSRSSWTKPSRAAPSRATRMRQSRRRRRRS